MTHTPNDFRVFGSLVYVLDLSSQSGSLGPGKWKERSYQGVYIGHSLHHACNVILVYNLKTQLVSPQYHIVHDESFKTVWINTSEADLQQKLDKMLDALFVTSQWIHSDAYSDCDPLTTSHHYLDSSWDFANETIHVIANAILMDTFSNTRVRYVLMVHSNNTVSINGILMLLLSIGA